MFKDFELILAGLMDLHKKNSTLKAEKKPGVLSTVFATLSTDKKLNV